MIRSRRGKHSGFPFINLIIAGMLAAGLLGCQRAEALEITGAAATASQAATGATSTQAASAEPASQASTTDAATQAASVEPEADAEKKAETSAQPERQSFERRSFVKNGHNGSINALSDSERSAMEAFLNEEGSYGFLLSIYDVPQQVDVSQVFYLGAGLKTGTPSGEEREDYLEAAGLDEDPNVMRLTKDQINDYLQYRLGIALDKLYVQPDWVYLEKYDSYYLTHTVEVTNLRTIEVLDAFEKDGLYTVHYREKIPQAHWDGYCAPVYEVTLRQNGDGYRFCSNRLWAQNNMIPDGTRRVALHPYGYATLYAYKPVTSVSDKADVTFALVQNGNVRCYLPGMEKGNIRTDRVFESVEGIAVDDYSGDGNTDILILCRYKNDDGKGREDGLEARLYHCRPGKTPKLDRNLSQNINAMEGTLTLTGIEYFLRTGKTLGTYDSYKEAYTAVLEALGSDAAGETLLAETPSGTDAADTAAEAAEAETPSGTDAASEAETASGTNVADVAETVNAADDRFAGFAILNVEDGRTRELLMMGKDEVTGARIISFHDGIIEEAQISRSFSYLARLNLIMAKRGNGGVFEETIYMFSGGRLGRMQRGQYGSLDSARTIYMADGRPHYSYYWEGSPLNEEGYTDAKTFAYDIRHAENAQDIKLKTREEMLAELK